MIKGQESGLAPKKSRKSEGVPFCTTMVHKMAVAPELCATESGDFPEFNENVHDLRKFAGFVRMRKAFLPKKLWHGFCYMSA